MVVGTVIDVLPAVCAERGQNVDRINAGIKQHLHNSGIVCHRRIGREFIRQHLRRHRDEAGLHGDPLCRQYLLQLRQCFRVGCELLFAVRDEFVHQERILADIDAAAFPFAGSQIQIGFHRDPAIPQGGLDR